MTRNQPGETAPLSQQQKSLIKVIEDFTLPINESKKTPLEKRRRTSLIQQALKLKCDTPSTTLKRHLYEDQHLRKMLYTMLYYGMLYDDTEEAIYFMHIGRLCHSIGERETFYRVGHKGSRDQWYERTGNILLLACVHKKTNVIRAIRQLDLEISLNKYEHASPFCENCVDHTGRDSLMISIEKGNLEAIKIILMDDRNFMRIGLNRQNISPLGVAISHGHLDIVKFFLDPPFLKTTRATTTWLFGQRENIQCDETCYPIHMAAAKDQVEIVKYLVEEAKFDINKSDASTLNLSPLMYTAFKGNRATATWLLSQSEAILERPALPKHSAYFLASESSNGHKVLDLFRQRGAKPICYWERNSGFSTEKKEGTWPYHIINNAVVAAARGTDVQKNIDWMCRNYADMINNPLPIDTATAMFNTEDLPGLRLACMKHTMHEPVTYRSNSETYITPLFVSLHSSSNDYQTTSFSSARTLASHKAMLHDPESVDKSNTFLEHLKYKYNHNHTATNSRALASWKRSTASKEGLTRLSQVKKYSFASHIDYSNELLIFLFEHLARWSGKNDDEFDITFLMIISILKEFGFLGHVPLGVECDDDDRYFFAIKTICSCIDDYPINEKQHWGRVCGFSSAFFNQMYEHDIEKNKKGKIRHALQQLHKFSFKTYKRVNSTLNAYRRFANDDLTSMLETHLKNEPTSKKTLPEVLSEIWGKPESCLAEIWLEDRPNQALSEYNEEELKCIIAHFKENGQALNSSLIRLKDTLDVSDQSEIDTFMDAIYGNSELGMNLKLLSNGTGNLNSFKVSYKKRVETNHKRKENSSTSSPSKIGTNLEKLDSGNQSNSGDKGYVSVIEELLSSILNHSNIKTLNPKQSHPYSPALVIREKHKNSIQRICVELTLKDKLPAYFQSRLTPPYHRPNLKKLEQILNFFYNYNRTICYVNIESFNLESFNNEEKRQYVYKDTTRLKQKAPPRQLGSSNPTSNFTAASSAYPYVNEIIHLPTLLFMRTNASVLLPSYAGIAWQPVKWEDIIKYLSGECDGRSEIQPSQVRRTESPYNEATTLFMAPFPPNQWETKPNHNQFRSQIRQADQVLALLFDHLDNVVTTQKSQDEFNLTFMMIISTFKRFGLFGDNSSNDDKYSFVINLFIRFIDAFSTESADQQKNLTRIFVNEIFARVYHEPTAFNYDDNLTMNTQFTQSAEEVNLILESLTTLCIFIFKSWTTLKNRLATFRRLADDNLIKNLAPYIESKENLPAVLCVIWGKPESELAKLWLKGNDKKALCEYSKSELNSISVKLKSHAQALNSLLCNHKDTMTRLSKPPTSDFLMNIIYGNSELSTHLQSLSHYSYNLKRFSVSSDTQLHEGNCSSELRSNKKYVDFIQDIFSMVLNQQRINDATSSTYLIHRNYQSFIQLIAIKIRMHENLNITLRKGPTKPCQQPTSAQQLVGPINFLSKYCNTKNGKRLKLMVHKEPSLKKRKHPPDSSSSQKKNHKKPNNLVGVGSDSPELDNRANQTRQML